ncbi:MAG TPA: hypothetical protein VGJ87_21470 [Roseiflexaceae bacterium]
MRDPHSAAACPQDDHLIRLFRHPVAARVRMKTTHHATKTELLIGRNLKWVRQVRAGAGGLGRAPRPVVAACPECRS